jgi:hypothetical protein
MKAILHHVELRVATIIEQVNVRILPVPVRFLALYLPDGRLTREVLSSQPKPVGALK